MKIRLPHFSALARHSGGGMNPERDWTALLISALVLLVLIVGWHIWAFKTVVSGGTLGSAEQGTVAPVQTSVLDTIPAFLDKRATEDANYINGVYRFADPSQ